MSLIPFHLCMESKTGKCQMIAIQLSFVPGAGGDLIEGVK